MAKQISKASTSRSGHMNVSPKNLAIWSMTMIGSVAWATAAPQKNKNVNTKPYPYGNPVIHHLYTADAAPKVMPDGRVWMVTSIDHENGGGYSTMHAIRAFSTVDMKNWVDEGEILHLDDLNEKPGEDWAIWAPDIVYRNGTYYLYFPMRNIRADGRMDRYVAVAESPSMRKRFQVTNPRMRGVPTAGLDPAVFIDDDGSAYLYWNQLFMGELRDDMRDIKGRPFKLNIGANNFMEAAWMHKRAGRYYFNYHTKYDGKIDPENPDNTARKKSLLEYSMGDSPRGPLKHMGTINHELGVGVTNGPKLPGRDYVPWRLTQSNHGGVVEYHGQDYLFYHNSALSSWRQDEFKGPGTWTQRSVCVDYLNYAPDGSIIPVRQTIEGVSAVKIDQPFEIRLSSDARFNSNIIEFQNVKFGTGYYYFDATLKSDPAFKGKIKIRLDRADGPLVGTCLLHPERLKTRNGLFDTYIRDAKGSRNVFLVLIPDTEAKASDITLLSPRFFAGAPEQGK
jgi:arabinoxylan arabinofuranohydrolase